MKVRIVVLAVVTVATALTPATAPTCSELWPNWIHSGGDHYIGIMSDGDASGTQGYASLNSVQQCVGGGGTATIRIAG